MIKAQISDNSLTSASQQAFTLYDKTAFGERKNNLIIYADVEVLYLVEKDKMEVFLGKNTLSFEILKKKLKKKDKKIEQKYIVYKDLRNKGYIPKVALKYGAEFRVYEKGSHPSKSHSPWLVSLVQETDNLGWSEIAAKIRVAHSTKKKLLIALIDSSSDVTYYETDWKRM